MSEQRQTLSEIFTFSPDQLQNRTQVTILELIHEASLDALQSGYSLSTIQSFLALLTENIPKSADVVHKLMIQFDPILESMTGDQASRESFESAMSSFVTSQKTAGISKTSLVILIKEYLEMKASQRKGSLANVTYPIVPIAIRIIESVYES